MIERLTLAMAVAIPISILIGIGAILAGTPRFDLISQGVEDTITMSALFATGTSTVLLVILTIVRSLK